MKKRILIYSPYFFPGYKGGGPIQSITNLIIQLYGDYDFFVVTSAFDLGEAKPYVNIVLNEWIDVELLKCIVIKTYYADSNISLREIKQQITEVNSDILYINGIYTNNFFLKPLITARLFFFKKAISTIIAPRGMFQRGALQVKSFKKKIYLSFLKAAGLFNGIKWHATSIDEKEDIFKQTGAGANILIASNIPVAPIKHIQQIVKNPGSIKLIFLSVITEKKNLHLLIEMLSQVNDVNVFLDIYGPIKEASYWNLCLNIISRMPSNISISYKGVLTPAQVQTVIQSYHVMVLLTKGENFGHALFEAFSSGRPVITSNFTPWNNLIEREAGFNVSIDNSVEFLQAIRKINQLSQQAFDQYCDNAHKMALNYFYDSDFKSQYAKLFN